MEGSGRCLFVLVDHMGVPYWIGWGIANLAMFLVWTYPTNRYLVFRERRAASSETVK